MIIPKFKYIPKSHIQDPCSERDFERLLKRNISHSLVCLNEFLSGLEQTWRLADERRDSLSPEFMANMDKIKSLIDLIKGETSEND